MSTLIAGTATAVVTGATAAMLYYNKKKQNEALKKQGAYGKVPLLKTESKWSVLKRPSEIIAALKFKSRMKTFQKEQTKRDRHRSEDSKYCTFILNKVSRSFAGVIAQLPNELRESVCVFYLALRALDTIEDEMDLSRFNSYLPSNETKGNSASLRETKIRLMKEFSRRLEGKEKTNLKGIGEAFERDLLEHFDRVVRVFKSLPKKYRDVILNITERMSRGMARYVGRDLRNGTTHTRDYNRYCEIVAGYVGEGLSELWVASGLESSNVLKDREAIYAMGLFLQKTNIIRDYLEDLTEGRTFWPKEIWSHYASDLSKLRDEDLNGKCVNHMVADALLLLPACLRYLNSLKTDSIFRFCAIPQLMAIATLSHVQKHNKLVYQGVLKIPKTKAAWLIVDVACSRSSTDTYIVSQAREVLQRLGSESSSCDVVMRASIRASLEGLRHGTLKFSRSKCSSSSSTNTTKAQEKEEKEDACSRSTALSVGSVLTAAVLGYTLRQFYFTSSSNDFDAGTIALFFVSCVYLYVALFTSRTSQSGRLMFLDDDEVSNPKLLKRKPSAGYIVQEPRVASSILPDEKENDLSKNAFKQSFKKLTKGLVKDIAAKHELQEEATSWLQEMIEYNVQGGKMNRGLTVVHSFRAMKGERLSTQELEDASTLGWCIEWLQAFFLVADDVMDRSVTRRGQPCWYKRPHVKEIAINDSFILESCVFELIRKRFRGRTEYVSLLELFHEVTLQTEIGQLLDLTSQPIDGKPDLRRFTPSRHAAIVKYKTAFYSFYLPVACGMILSGIEDPEAFRKAKEICCIMGEYFQVQDDYLDCYGDPKVIGKIGTDIQDNKCSWLVVQALQRSSKKQQELLIESYGKDDEQAVRRVKSLYKDLDLENVYLDYEQKSYERLNILIENVDELIPSAVFRDLLLKIYKREK